MVRVILFKGAEKLGGRKFAMITRHGITALACYNYFMSNSTLDHKHRTTMMPVTTMEEVPILSEEERAEMLASLKEAEAQIAAGQFTVFDPKTFQEWLLSVYRAAKNSKTA